MMGSVTLTPLKAAEKGQEGYMKPIKHQLEKPKL